MLSNFRPQRERAIALPWGAEISKSSIERKKERPISRISVSSTAHSVRRIRIDARQIFFESKSCRLLASLYYVSWRVAIDPCMRTRALTNTYLKRWTVYRSERTAVLRTYALHPFNRYAVEAQSM
jgi:hypothetical protein